MKRLLSCIAMAAAVLVGSGSPATAGLFFHRRVVYRPIIVNPVYVAPVQPVTAVVYRPAPVVYRTPPVVYAPAYYVPAPAYYVPVAPVVYGW